MHDERATTIAAIGALALLLAGLALPAHAESVARPRKIETALDGKRLVGQVRTHFVRVANDVLLDAARAPGTAITRDTVHFVDVEFPNCLSNGENAILAQVVGASDVRVGDVVEVSVAHKNNPHFFPVKESTKVTELVAKSDTTLARDFARTIALARRGVPAPQAMSEPSPGTVLAKN